MLNFVRTALLLTAQFAFGSAASTAGEAAAPKLELQPFQLALPHQLTASQASSEWHKSRDFGQESHGTGVPRPLPTSCEALVSRWDEWSTKAAVGGGKFAEIAYVRAMADCLALRYLRSAKPSSTTLAAALPALSVEDKLSGDFFPQLPRAGESYEVKAVDDELQVVLKGPGASDAAQHHYHLLAGFAGKSSDEWLAVEEVDTETGNFSDCSFVVIAKHWGRFEVQDRRNLGRCG